MLSVILFFVLSLLLISAGCVYAAARFSLCYEEALPLSLVGIVLFLFVFGLFGLLDIGVYALLLVSLLLYASVWRLSAGQWRTIREKVFRPAALLFFLGYAVLLYLNYGRLPYLIDEMTHWADSVKVMYYAGMLYSAPQAAVSFPSYPPGMALFEYLFLRLFDLVSGKPCFAEWVMYVAYQSFLLSFLFPFLRSLDFRKPLRAFLAFILVVLCPLMMDGSAPYSSLYIDPFLCACFGGALAAIFTEPQKDRLSYDLFIYAACAMLMLVKPAGLLLAFLLFVVYTAEFLLRCADRKLRMLRIAAASGSFLLPLGLWSLRKRIDGVTQSFSSKEGTVDFRLVMNLVFHREGETWQQVVHDDYYTRLFSDTVRIKGLQCPYWVLFAVSVLGLFLLVCLMCRRYDLLQSSRILVLPALTLIAIVYYVGLCYTYIFQFGWWEAIVLASLNRYIGIVLYAVYTAAMLALVRFFTETENGMLSLCAALAVFFLFSPFGRALDVVRRTAMDEIDPLYLNYREINALLAEETNGDPVRLDIISQGSRGGRYYPLRYIMRPNTIVPYGEWYLGPSPGKGWESDLNDRMSSADEWCAELRDHYDYVYIIQLDDYFLSHYNELFAEGSEPKSQSLYRFDGQKLIRILN